jgi:hypothetical protein
MLRVNKWEDVQPGDLGWYVGPGIISDAIEHITARKDLISLGFKIPSHVFIVLNKTQVIEALEKTKVRSKLEYKADFEAGNVYIFRPDAPEQIVKDTLLEFYSKYDNHPYGWLQILGFIPVLLLRKLHLNVFNPFPLGTVCSEDGLIYLRMLMLALSKAGETEKALKLGWTVRLDPNTTDPALLLICCIKDDVPPYM